MIVPPRNLSDVLLLPERTTLSLQEMGCWMKLLPKEVTDDKMGKDRMMKEEVAEKNG